MRILIFIAIILFFCSSYRTTNRTGNLLHAHGWEIFYNDSLIYSTNPTIDNKTWKTKRWGVHELQLGRNKIDSSDNIRINYQSDVIRHYYKNIQVRSQIDTLLLSIENSNQLQLIELIVKIANSVKNQRFYL